MNNMNVKLLRRNKAIWTLIRVFYQLSQKVWQFATRATNLGIDFRKLECEELNSGYTSTCTRDETDNEKRLPREEKLAYELNRRSSAPSGLGRIWPGPTLAGLAWPRLGAARDWVLHAWVCLAWVLLAWSRRSPEVASSGLARGKKERRKKEEEKRRRGKEEREEKERRGGEEGRKWKYFRFCRV